MLTDRLAGTVKISAPNLAFFAATLLLWLLVTGIAPLTAMLVVVLIGLSLGIPTAVLGSRTVFSSPAALWLHAGVALIVIGVCAMTGRALHLSPTTLPLTIGGLGLIGCVLRAVYRQRQAGSHQVDDVAAAKSDPGIGAALRASLGFSLLALIGGSTYFIYAYWMGHGAVPEYFFGVDNAFHLSLVQALIQSDLLPPPSLTYAGSSLVYQYGVLDTASTLVRLAGIAPHAALFLVTMPMMVMAIAAGCWSILSRISSPLLRVCCFGVMVVSTFQHWSIPFDKHVFKAVVKMLHGGLGADLSIDQNFHHTATLAGIVVALYTIWAWFSDRRPVTRLFGAVVIGLLICVKSLFFLPLGLWIGVAAVVEAGLESHRQGWKPRIMVRSLRHFVYPALALIVAVTIQAVQGVDGGALHIAFAPLADPYVNKNLVKLLLHVLILLAPLLVVLVAARGRIWSGDLVVSALLILATYGFVSMTALVWTDSAETDFNWFQVATLTPILIGLLVTSAYAIGWGHIRSSLGRGLLVVGIIACCGTQLIREAEMALNTAANPTLGWEALDNRGLIAALACIPVDGSVTVTNDLRSPAENYKRPYRNTQLAAIMGQHFYFSVPAYDHAQPGWAARMDQQHLLESNDWSTGIDEAARQNGWTHLLLHHTVSGPANIPLPKVCDAGEYTVYKFQ